MYYEDFSDTLNRYYEVIAYPVEQDTFATFFLDVTHRVITEKELEASRDAYLALTENSPDVTLRFNRKLQHVFASKNVVGFLGLTASEIIGKSVRDLNFPEEICIFWEAKMKHVFETNEIAEFSLPFKKPDGEMLEIDWRIVPEANDKGRVKTLLVISRDITRQKNLNKTLNAFFKWP
ncbi:MAG: PAS domain-containing protein [Bacteroidales bacterium]|nr:PAS domain-containing protein [Bacteroidales bacterium]